MEQGSKNFFKMAPNLKFPNGGIHNPGGQEGLISGPRGPFPHQVTATQRGEQV